LFLKKKYSDYVHGSKAKFAELYCYHKPEQFRRALKLFEHYALWKTLMAQYCNDGSANEGFKAILCFLLRSLRLDSRDAFNNSAHRWLISAQ